MNFIRIIKTPDRSFFLFGPRATGKSTWLKQAFTSYFHLDLLRNDIYFTLQASPAAFRERVLAQDAARTWIVVDEIQRIPGLLNDVHSLIENEGYRFALSGSSARKLKRGHANLLAGRALVKHLFPLTYREYQNAATLEEALLFGTLPSIIADKNTRLEQLEAYVGTYLREEIKEEALTRNVPSFARFLEVVALMNGQVTNLSNIARDAMIPRATVSTYFEILVDTLLGHWLPAFKPRAKVKEVSHAKFYFFDCGVVRGIQKLLHDKASTEEQGILFETFIFNELNAYLSYENRGGELFYWKTADGTEVDFVWKRGKNIIAIEVKSTTQWKEKYDAGLKIFSTAQIGVTACYGVYCGNDTLKKDFGWIFPWRDFLRKLYAGEIFPN